MMNTLMTPFYGRRSFLIRRRPLCLRTLARRYQLAKLFGLVSAIGLIWLIAQLDNSFSVAPAPQPAGIESANADLIAGVPVGKHRSM